LSDGADHSGTATAEMTVLVADMADEGAYYCIVTLGAQSAPSQNTMLGIKTLEAHWTMDQTDYVGGLYLDISGNAHDADPNGEWIPTFTTGADGTTATGAVTVDTASGWAQAGTWNPSENSNCLTISVWVNWNGTGDGSGIAAKRDGWGPDNGMWQLTVNEFGGLWLAGGDFSHTVDANLPADEWHHVCATVDLDNIGAMYVDGELLETFDFSLGNKTDSPVVIGIVDTDPFLRSFNGSLDDIRIYNYALTQDEIVAEYYATSNTPACVNRPAMDMAGPEGEPDCLVNIHDFAFMVESWLDCGFEPFAACTD
ncbi:MAG: LamG domain-containing protein, partial [Planctomycetes bacterium]|nr:LamG domain-containing protein [Planctomycetota bacterium]